ncbi:MAG: hypothetical protein K2X76_05070 [Sphingomonas sp.]|nr:hypothetical protein [Sphingomonas sp.]
MIPDPLIQARASADGLVAGFYLLPRRRAGRVDLPVRIWFGPPEDEDGTPLDRSPRWQVAIAGTVLDFYEPVRLGGMTISALDDVWPACAAHPIDEADYRYRIARQDYAAAHDPEDPFGTPGARIDPMTARLPFL